jgi:hypothetical protein
MKMNKYFNKIDELGRSLNLHGSRNLSTFYTHEQEKFTLFRKYLETNSV